LTIVDVYTRESVAIEVGQRLKGNDVVRVLNRANQQCGVPKLLFCDNGSEFTSQANTGPINQIKACATLPVQPVQKDRAIQ
jgi:transposase InsO family protein